MALLRLAGEPGPTPLDIEPLGYVGLWQAMRRADSALAHHGLRHRLPDYSLTEKQLRDLGEAADILDPDRADPEARFTEYGVAIPPDRLAANLQDLIDGQDAQFNDVYFDATTRLRLAANALRQLATGGDVAPESLPIVRDTVSTLLQHGVDQFVD